MFYIVQSILRNTCMAHNNFTSIHIPNYWLHAVTGEQLYRSKTKIDMLKIIIIVVIVITY